VEGMADSLFVGSGADLQGGLVRGYGLALEHFAEGGVNRVVLITDGRASPEAVDPKFIGEHTKKGEDQGIYLVGVGTGPAEGYNDALLNTLTDYGRGAYVYIDSEAEAQKMFTGRFTEVMDIAARSVEVKLQIPDYLHLQTYYGESVGTEAERPDPQHLAPGDAMVFNMTLNACNAQAFNQGDMVAVDVAWQRPVDGVSMSIKKTLVFGDIMGPDLAPMLKGSAVIAYAEALKSLDKKRIEEAALTVGEALKSTGDADLEEIQGLLALHPALAAPLGP
jgi:Ca-activated chloride channel homolog